VVMSLILTTFPKSSFAQSDVTVKVNGEEISLQPAIMMENDRILVPLNGVFEKLEAEVKWEKEKNKVFIEDNYTLIEILIDKNIALVHKKFDFTGIPLEVKLDVSPKVDGDTIYVPLRFVAESLEAKVGWDSESNSALISTKPDTNDIDFMIISQDDINSDSVLSKWYEENKVTKGIYYTKANDSTYIMVSAGAKDTGGYTIKINGVILNKPDDIYIYACVENPLSDSILTQVISYPCAFIKIDNSKIESVDGTIY